MNTKNALILIAVILIADIMLAKSAKQPRVIVRSKVPFSFNAQTLPPFGIVVKDGHQNNKMLLKHEKVHWDQYRRSGAVLYYFKYALQYIAYGYDRMPMELEARQRTGETEYCINNYTKCVKSGEALTVNNDKFRN